MKEKLLSLLLLCVVLAGSAHAQTRKISGKVTSAEDGSPLTGVSVIVVGTSAGTQTDAAGNYTITASEGAQQLEFRLVGFQSTRIGLGQSALINVSLEVDASTLDEVIVTGYGTTTRRDLIGSVSSIKTDLLTNRPVQSFDQALAGKAAGVQISIPNGVLNNPPVFRIRGTNSISLSSYPLIVIDGVPTFTGDVSGSNAGGNALASLNPNDIETMDILKDAAATAIYGSRAANGVVVITTKKGAAGKAIVSYDGWFGVNQVQRLPKLLDAFQYTEIKNEGLVNAGTFSDNLQYRLTIGPDGQPINTNWYDYAYRDGLSHSHSLSIRGGSESTSYYFSANVTDQQGIILTNDYKRLGALFNVDHKISKIFSVGGKLQYTKQDNLATISSGSLSGQAFGTAGLGRIAMINAPNVAPFTNDGEYNLTGNNLGVMDNLVSQIGFYNPVVLIERNRSFNYLNGIQANGYFQAQPFSWLTFKSLYGIDYLYSTNDIFNNPIHGDGFAGGGSATNNYTARMRWVWTNTLNANYTFNNAHTVTALIGTEQQRSTDRRFGAGRTGLSDPEFDDFSASYQNFSTTGSYGENYLVSFFGSLAYDFKKKYFVSGSIRQDEYSAFGPNNKAGVFYSVGASYEIAQENFWENAGLDRVFSSFKLRGSYGTVGNQNGIGDLASRTFYEGGLFGGQPTLYPNSSGNEDIGWETSKKLDLGINFGILRDRFTFEMAYYKNDIDGLIYNVPQAPSAGLPSNPQLNIGSMYNRGVELTVNAQAVNKPDFSWSPSFNITYNENEITSLAPGITQFTSSTSSLETVSISRVGSPLGMIYVARTAGVDPATGRRIFINAEGEQVYYDHSLPVAQRWQYADGSVAPGIGSVDQIAYANPQPKFFGGFINSFRYKSFDLALNFTYQLGYYVYFGTGASIMDQRFWNNSTDMLRRWTAPGQDTDVPRVVAGDNVSNGSATPLDIHVYKGDFLKLRDVTFGYALPLAVLQKINISRTRIYVSAQNAFIFTGYPGTDPEASSNGGSNSSQGVERNSVGNGRTFTVGLNLTF
ncbi:TonB-linked outer membrane protein, SusC/RagA family [Parapedobacter luteus]|uniref:TonB-linked outer membrane protein, SusC/RagA family n=1 Tax=Parapedobacter luteus TaxID=623280 RepID=A0A1T5E4F6_9SPHI|nr:SusC/RagA family TonB-linked outer membrane protein [Parapedobacter luteus]SKB78710.1 TonB-linked outer membrane protein, SusC/RagA family [Parapedobacter luteus]